MKQKRKNILLWSRMIKLIVLLVVIVVVFLLCGKSHTKDNFKILGSLAPQKQMYWQCLSDCERGDPSLQMTPSKGSMSCLEYCDSTITDMVRRGGASYPRDINAAPVGIVNSIDSAYSVCGDGTKGNFCRKNFTSSTEIDAKCRINCAYNPTHDCMQNCTKSLNPNKSSGWSWK